MCAGRLDFYTILKLKVQLRVHSGILRALINLLGSRDRAEATLSDAGELY